MKINNLKKRFFTSLVLFLFLSLIIVSNYLLVFFLLTLGVLSILEFINLTKRIFKKKLSILYVSLLFIFYVFTFCYLFYLFSLSYQFKVILFSLLLGCIASDIGGFVFGNVFKGPRLISISPNKTISGAIGSIILSLFTIPSLIFYLTGYFDYKIFLVSISTSIFCQLGDLFFSFLKRKAKLKDTGKIFPGHGGVLDRLDGIFVGTPFGFLTLIIIV